MAARFKYTLLLSSLSNQLHFIFHLLLIYSITLWSLIQNKHFNSMATWTSLQLRRPPTLTRSRSISSFWSTLSNLKRGQQYWARLWQLSVPTVTFMPYTWARNWPHFASARGRPLIYRPWLHTSPLFSAHWKIELIFVWENVLWFGASMINCPEHWIHQWVILKASLISLSWC